MSVNYRAQLRYGMKIDNATYEFWREHWLQHFKEKEEQGEDTIKVEECLEFIEEYCCYENGWDSGSDVIIGIPIMSVDAGESRSFDLFDIMQEEQEMYDFLEECVLTYLPNVTPHFSMILVNLVD